MQKTTVKELFWIILLSAAQSEIVADPYLNQQTTNEPNVYAPIATTPLGKMMGSMMKTRFGKAIFAFRGIRYAEAPIDELRFQPPVPVGKWKGVYNATQDRFACPQDTDFFGPMSEDCLFLNVYTTELPKGQHNPKRPVMVYFHTGAFLTVSGLSFLEGPRYLLDQDIVLVVPNYRLGALGFLSTGDQEAPGNNGMKDQVVVLQWIKDNTAAFGGNPDSVTIAGYSAGGVSGTLHLVSPLSKGLFHRVIAMSGSIFGQWPLPYNQLDLAKKQARLVNCPDDNSTVIIKCLKTKSADELGHSLPGFAEFGFEPVLLWRPVIEPDFGQPRFLTAHPIELVLKGQFKKVPIVIGLTADEFAGRAFNLLGNETLLTEFNEHFQEVAPIVLLYERESTKSKVISKSLRNFYFGNREIDNSSLPSLAKIYADGISGFAVNRAAKLLAEKSNQPVYYYCFNFTGRYSHFYWPGTEKPYGVVHHDDLIYIFSSTLPLFNKTDPETVAVDKWTTIWANFAKTGKPIPIPNETLDNVDWVPYTSDNQKYLYFGKRLTIRDRLFEERYLEWEKLFPFSDYQSDARK